MYNPKDVQILLNGIEVKFPYIPIPRLTSNGNTALKWYCHSAEYCTHDGLDAFFCSGHGDTPGEAYKDWLESYTNDRYYEEERYD